MSTSVPTIDFVFSPCPAIAGRNIRFEPLATDFTPTTFLWEFGDLEGECGDRYRQERAVHRFYRVGSYTVKLTATDGVFTATKTKCIKVVASFWGTLLAILVFIIVVAVIVFLIWWFFFKMPKQACSSLPPPSQPSCIRAFPVPVIEVIATEPTVRKASCVKRI